MSEKFLTEIVRSERMSLSQLIWRLFRRQPRGYLERVLEANQDLALQTPFLTVGTTVKLPIDDVPIVDRAPDVVIRLWD